MKSFNLNLTIESISLLRIKDGTDHIFIKTKLPSAMPKISSQPLTLHFEVQHGTGIEYCEKIFGVTPDIWE